MLSETFTVCLAAVALAIVTTDRKKIRCWHVLRGWISEVDQYFLSESQNIKLLVLRCEKKMIKQLLNLVALIRPVCHGWLFVF